MKILKIALKLIILLTVYNSIAETTTYFINDNSSSPVAAMDQAGNLLWKESYTPFGDKRIRSSLNKNDVGFTGHQSDDSTGLTYMQSRYYDPVVGRFYSNDPVGYSYRNPVMSFNRYLYANNNPYRYTDPNGQFPVMLDPFSWWATASTGALGKDAKTAADATTKQIVRENVPGLDLGIKVMNGEEIGVMDVVDVIPQAKKAKQARSIIKKFSKEKQALVNMAKKDKKSGGITAGDMKAYKDLNKELPDPFPSNTVRGPEVHPNRPHGKEPHGHVGPVNHIPVKKD